MGYCKYTEDNQLLNMERLWMRNTAQKERNETKVSCVRIVTTASPVSIRQKEQNNKKEKKEQKIICKDCGQGFLFTEWEALFYKKQGFDNPKRCPECRQCRRKEKRKEGNER